MRIFGWRNDEVRKKGVVYGIIYWIIYWLQKRNDTIVYGFVYWILSTKTLEHPPYFVLWNVKTRGFGCFWGGILPRKKGGILPIRKTLIISVMCCVSIVFSIFVVKLQLKKCACDGYCGYDLRWCALMCVGVCQVVCATCAVVMIAVCGTYKIKSNEEA